MADPRSTYWTERYETYDWEGGIHFGSFDDVLPGSRTSLAEATKAADTWLVRKALEECSIFRLVTGFRVLDIGCGNTTLGECFTNMLPTCHYVGLDSSPSAISKARAGNKSPDNDNRCEYYEGGVDKLRKISFNQKFDLIIVREMLYLLSVEERNDLVASIQTLLRTGGFLYFSDLVMIDTRAELEIQRYLYDRHRAKGPILCARSGEEDCIRAFLTSTFGDRFEVAYLYHDANDVYESYRLAQRLGELSHENKDAYRVLEGVASKGRVHGPGLTYARAFLIDKTKSFRAEPEADFEFVRLKKMPYDHVLRPNETYGFPRGARTLLIGRSGCGKTTILRLVIEGRPRDAVAKRSFDNYVHRFWLTQNLQLLDNLSVLENVEVFSSKKNNATDYLKKLAIPERRWRAHISKLSGGELQRVAIAQCLASNASLVVLDEPLKGLDKPLRLVLFDIFREASVNKNGDFTMICVDHDFEYIAKHFDFVYEVIAGYQFPIK